MRILPLFLLSAVLTAPVMADDAPAGQHGAHHQKLLDRFDANKDGKLDASERAAAKAAGQAKRDERFAKLDSNGDGSISKDEFTTRPHHPKAK